jgi:serine/threonine protein kinase
LSSELDLKISDFGGSSLAGSQPTVTPGSRYLHPDFDWRAPPVFGDDIFSLGSLLYFIMMVKDPYDDRSEEEVEKLYADQPSCLRDHY